jgi:hypothetical protein
MKPVLAAIVLTLAVARAGFADVTLTMTTVAEGLGATTRTPGTIYIKGTRMRSDVQAGAVTRTTILDLDAHKMYVFDSSRKEADVWNIEALAAELSTGAVVADVAASVTPNGQTRALAGHAAVGYGVDITVSSPFAGNRDMQVTATLAGPAWIVRDATGAAEYSRFYGMAAERGAIFSDPRSAKAQPGAALAMAAMHRRIAAIGGIPYSTETHLTFKAAGEKAAFLAQLGALSITTLVDAVRTDALADDLFAPPVDYVVRMK